jgi:hypothetical protein
MLLIIFNPLVEGLDINWGDMYVMLLMAESILATNMCKDEMHLGL